jgi:hypothetical protein
LLMSMTMRTTAAHPPAAAAASALLSRGEGSSSAVPAATATIVALPSCNDSETLYYVIEMPLFPIILPDNTVAERKMLEISVAVVSGARTSPPIVLSRD